MIARLYYTRAGQLVRVYLPAYFPRSGRRIRLRERRWQPLRLRRTGQWVRARLGW